MEKDKLIEAVKMDAVPRGRSQIMKYLVCYRSTYEKKLAVRDLRDKERLNTSSNTYPAAVSVLSRDMWEKGRNKILHASRTHRT